MGRYYQSLNNNNDEEAKQVVITLPLLEGLDGVKKMSKSLNNYIAIDDIPSEIFGKVMSISDNLMWRYFELLSDIDNKQLNQLKKAADNNEMNPRDIKIDLGMEIVSKFYDKNAALKAKEDFLSIFQKNKSPENLEMINVSKMPLPNLLKQIGFVPSTSEARRLIDQKALKINDKVIESIDYEISEGLHNLKLGKKKFAQINVKK
tara:strand:- start:262 stop:876 length:615 start_codon:yes stop_codon:yes gene_type:complete